MNARDNRRGRKAAGPFRIIGTHCVQVSGAGIRAFAARWPCCPLSDARPLRFEFDARGSLIDSNVTPAQDGPAALALCADAEAWLNGGTMPAWWAARAAALESRAAKDGTP